MDLLHSPRDMQEGLSVREDKTNNIAVYYSYLFRDTLAGDGVMSVWKPTKSMSWNSFYPLRHASDCGLRYRSGFGTFAHVQTLLHLREKLVDWHEWTFDYTNQDLNILPWRRDHLKALGIEVGKRNYSFPEALGKALKYAKTKGFRFPDETKG